MPRPRYPQPSRRDADTATAQLPLDTLCVVIPRQSIQRPGAHHLWTLEKHPDELVAYAHTLGFEQVQVLDWDMGISAYNTTIEDRSALRHWLRTLLPAGESKVVLVSQEDRLFRDETEIEHNTFIAEARKYGGWAVCVASGRAYNFQREADREQFRQQCRFAKQYVENQVIGRMHPANQRAAMKGFYPGGFLPWGYIVDYRDPHSPTYKHFVHYEPHALLVHDAVFRRFANMLHPNIAELARMWLREGLAWPFFGPEVDARTVGLRTAHCRVDPSGRGWRFSREQGRQILTDVNYLGWRFRAGELACETDGQPRICHEPLVDPDLFWWCFDRVLPDRPEWVPERPRLTFPVARVRPHRRVATEVDGVRFLAAGLLRCAEHQKTMTLARPGKSRLQVDELVCRPNDAAELGAANGCGVVRVAVIEDALCHAFVDQLTLSEQDVQQLAVLAEQRELAPNSAIADLERRLAEQEATYKAAKLATLEATRRAPELAGEFVDELRTAKSAVTELSARLEEAKRTSTPSVRAWAIAQRAAGWAERIRSTFPAWSRAAQARVLTLALESAVLGRVNRHVLGLWMGWHGGTESRQEIVRVNGVRFLWTEAEEEALRQHFATLSPAALYKMLPGRGITAIRSHAYQMGLTRKTMVGGSLAPVPVVALPEVSNEMVRYGFVPGELGRVEDARYAVGSRPVPPSLPSSTANW